MSRSVVHPPHVRYPGLLRPHTNLKNPVGKKRKRISSASRVCDVDACVAVSAESLHLYQSFQGVGITLSDLACKFLDEKGCFSSEENEV